MAEKEKICKMDWCRQPTNKDPGFIDKQLSSTTKQKAPRFAEGCIKLLFYSSIV
jgi:hypothetical protein